MVEDVTFMYSLPNLVMRFTVSSYMVLWSNMCKEIQAKFDSFNLLINKEYFKKVNIYAEDEKIQ